MKKTKTDQTNISSNTSTDEPIRKAKNNASSRRKILKMAGAAFAAFLLADFPSFSELLKKETTNPESDYHSSDSDSPEVESYQVSGWCIPH